MKIIIAGAGEVGTYLAKMLYKGNHDIIVIDTDKEKLQFINSHYDLLTIEGHATSILVLKEAEVKRADLFIAVTLVEATNITASIIAKHLGAKKTVARIDNGEYLLPENQSYLRSLGIDSMIYPEILASKEIINLINQSNISKTFDFAKGKLSLLALRIEEHSVIANKTMIEIAKENADLQFRIVAIARSEDALIPYGKDKVLSGDIIYIVINSYNLEDISRFTGLKQFNVKNVMILGGSRIGHKTAKSLEKEFYVKLLEKDKEKSLALADQLSHTLVINAEGRDIDFLIEEGIQNMDAYIAVTGNSEINILSCLLAKKLGAKKTIAEVENIDYIDLARNMGIDSIINKKLIAASHIYAFTVEAEVNTVQCLTLIDAEVLEFVAHKDSKVTQNKIKNINFPKGAIIGGIVRDDDSFIAVGDSQILANDKVVVFALPIAINQIAAFFK